MTDELGLAQAAVITKLQAVSALTNIVGSNGFHDTIADTTETGAYVLLEYAAGGGDNTAPRRAFDIVLRIVGVSTVQQTARDIAGYIDDALHEQSLTISGWAVYDCQREDFYNDSDTEGGETFYRKGAFYRIRADKTS